MVDVLPQFIPGKRTIKPSQKTIAFEQIQLDSFPTAQASFLARQRILQLLECYGFEGNRMLKLEPRIAEIQDLNKALQFWTTTLQPETIDAHPGILFWRPSVHTEAFNNLTKIFANTDISRMLNKSPHIMMDDWEEVEEKIDFALYTIGARHKDIVYSSYLSYKIEHIRTRYNFLFRSGLYIRPHKKDRKRHYSIPLTVMIESPHAEILKMTGLLAEEYATMAELTKKEMEKEERDIAHAATLSKRQLRPKGRRKAYATEIPEYDESGDDEDDTVDDDDDDADDKDHEGRKQD
ncbi:transcription termination factor 4, mitochondrial [Galendromus occidentalis]|uniref:Transcription termination factor 4, mitochondrial n=1 Tax=Galendromus occidentalis TaxID=34638 RepID=A0AAJ6QTW5_9ACAR|nr:transcription termination factor 4, mitochondrial [Galendromus occidentalis]